MNSRVQQAVAKTIETFGRIDVLINNASAINLSPTETIEPKRFDLMHGINVRGTFFTCQACIPHLKNAPNPHILNLSPPLNLNPKWFGQHLAYTMSKYGMSMIVLGLAEELKKYAHWCKCFMAAYYHCNGGRAKFIGWRLHCAKEPHAGDCSRCCVCGFEKVCLRHAPVISFLMKTYCAKKAITDFTNMP